MEKTEKRAYEGAYQFYRRYIDEIENIASMDEAIDYAKIIFNDINETKVNFRGNSHYVSWHGAVKDTNYTLYLAISIDTFLGDVNRILEDATRVMYVKDGGKDIIHTQDLIKTIKNDLDAENNYSILKNNKMLMSVLHHAVWDIDSCDYNKTFSKNDGWIYEMDGERKSFLDFFKEELNCKKVKMYLGYIEENYGEDALNIKKEGYTDICSSLGELFPDIPEFEETIDYLTNEEKENSEEWY